MSESSITDRLTKVFREVFGEETLILSRSTTAEDVEGWDSLTHINLIVAAEREFEFRFSTREITGLRNVGDMIDLIGRKQTAGTVQNR